MCLCVYVCVVVWGMHSGTYVCAYTSSAAFYTCEIYTSHAQNASDISVQVRLKFTATTEDDLWPPLTSAEWDEDFGGEEEEQGSIANHGPPCESSLT